MSDLKTLSEQLGAEYCNATHMDIKSKYQSIGRETAIALYDSGWWKNKTPREIAAFQLFTEELTCPFGVFHKAVEEALCRPVFTARICPKPRRPRR